jgi:hypothetical protein
MQELLPLVLYLLILGTPCVMAIRNFSAIRGGKDSSYSQG